LGLRRSEAMFRCREGQWPRIGPAPYTGPSQLRLRRRCRAGSADGIRPNGARPSNPPHVDKESSSVRSCTSQRGSAIFERSYKSTGRDSGFRHAAWVAARGTRAACQRRCGTHVPRPQNRLETGPPGKSLLALDCRCMLPWWGRQRDRSRGHEPSETPSATPAGSASGAHAG